MKSAVEWPVGHNGTDNYGFTVIPSGRNNFGDSGFEVIDTDCQMWTTSPFSEEEAFHINFSYNIGIPEFPKSIGLAIRCIKD